MAAVAFAPGDFAGERSAPLDPIAGFELRLLDKKFPVQITAGGKTEEHAAPVWVFMPEAGLAQAPLDDITQPADLDGGTTLLPAPPDGFGLRALKWPIRESFILADGRQAIVEIPVFVYFRRVEAQLQPMDPAPGLSTLLVTASNQSPTAAIAPAQDAKVELDRLRSELAEIHRQFSSIVPAVTDGTAKERLKTLVQQLGELTAPHDDRVGYSPDVSIDYNIKP
ncbi:MAG TPA: hypothetical protein VNW23_07680 [Opitutaceae bacterium]|nr:hypothetical protein [Opitutaceae bacterium]